MSVMFKLLEINDELVKVRGERDKLAEELAEAREKIDNLEQRMDEAIERERCLTNELNVVKDNLSQHLKLM